MKTKLTIRQLLLAYALSCLFATAPVSAGYMDFTVDSVTATEHASGC